ncbi:MAG TPA: hypothetical protein VGM91_19240 [Conexibacter sp.]
MAPAGLTNPIVAVCGVHGGAGTTTIAITLAAHAAQLAGPGAVLLTETDPCGGGLALALDGASPQGLAELATLRALGAQPPQPPVAQLPSGLRITAATAAEREPADPDDVAEVLLEAGTAHSLVVVDCGTIREPHRHGALLAATAVVWAISAAASAGVAHALAAGPLARSARHLHWLLAVSDTTGAGARAPLSELRSLMPEVRRVVLAPALSALPVDHPQRGDVANDLIEGMAA